MTLGQNIQTARKAKGMSQETLAEKIGVSRQALGKWEKDTALPGLDNLQALAAELGTGVDALLGAQAESPAAPAGPGAPVRAGGAPRLAGESPPGSATWIMTGLSEWDTLGRMPATLSNALAQVVMSTLAAAHTMSSPAGAYPAWPLLRKPRYWS